MTELPCPRCGADTTVVDIKRSYAGDDVGRLRECPTHGRFWSRESFFKWVPAKKDPKTDEGKPGQRAPKARGQSAGGKGGLSLISESDQSLRDGGQSKRSRTRGGALAYTPEFERLWTGCTDRRGHKYPAFRAFLKFKPDYQLVVSRYRQWQQTEQWKRGIIPHLSTLLNARFWENEPGRAEFIQRPNLATPLPLRLEDARQTRALDARIESLREMGIGKPQRQAPTDGAVSDHLRALADGNVLA